MTAHSLNIEPDEQIRQTIRRARAEREAEERRRVLKLVAPSALPKADELNRLAKATFPGAKIQPTRRTHMLPFDDAIPF